MTDAADPPQRDMTKTWEGNRQKRRKRLAGELNTSGRWLARPLKTDAIPDAPGVYISDTVWRTPGFSAVGTSAIALWIRTLVHPDRAVIEGRAFISDSLAGSTSHSSDSTVAALLDQEIWERDETRGGYFVNHAGQAYAIVGEAA